MYSDHLKETIGREVEPILTGMGFNLVELTVARQKGSTKIGVVMYGPSGVGIQECSEVSRLLYPRLETIEGISDVSLEVSSPGIERTLKSPEEYALFRGRGIRILVDDETEWLGGVLEKAESGVLTLKIEGNAREFGYASIRKARLDHKWDPPRGGTGSKEETHAV